MKQYTDGDRYVHSILDVCVELHSSLTGSGEPLSDDQITSLADWLVWRITDGWLPTYSDQLARRRYDNGVRNLARATLIMVMSR